MFISSHHRRFTSKAVRLSSLLVSSPRRSLYALTYAQPPTSPIDTSRASAKGLASIPSTSFHLHVNFLSLIEQEQLLRAALKRLDEIRGVSRALKQRRKALQTPVARPHSWSSGHPLLDCFYPEDCYDFSEVSLLCSSRDTWFDTHTHISQAHFDSVIHNYRESHVSNWPEDVKPILTKVAKLMPPGDLELSTVQCHALHLAPSGVILPHIDNIEASGGTYPGCFPLS